MSFVSDSGYGVSGAGNTTTTNLASGATFTGEAEQNPFPDVMVSCFSDTAGTLFFDFSNDGSIWRTFPTNGFTVSASIHEFHTAVKGPIYFRVRFVNSATIQTNFQLYTYYGTYRQPNTPLNQPISLDSDSLLVRPTFPWLDISRGLVNNISTIAKFGYNENIGTSFEPISYNGVYQTPQSSVSLEFVSSDAADALDDVGMHEITIEGIDENWQMQTVTESAHPNDGTTAVAISGSWLRVFRAFVSSSGTYSTQTSGSHVGNITIRVASAGATYAVIPLINSYPFGQTMIGAYTIPINKKGFVFLRDLTADSGKTINYGFFFRENANDITSSFSAGRIQEFKTGITGGSLYNSSTAKVPLGPFVGPCDISYMGYSSGGGGSASISCEFEIFLVDD